MGNTTRIDTQAKLVQALDRYGLTPGDLRGIESRWAEVFSILESPRPDSMSRVIATILGNPDYGRPQCAPTMKVQPVSDEFESLDSYTGGEPTGNLVIEVETRNGGLNREHEHGGYDIDLDVVPGCTACATEALQAHPLYLHDEDNDWDCTYADFYFAVPADQVQSVIEAQARLPEIQAWDKAHRLLDQIVSGAVAPWSLLASEAKAADVEGQINRAHAQAMTSWVRSRTEKELFLHQDLLEALTTGVLDPSVGNQTFRLGQERWSDTLSGPSAVKTGNEHRQLVERVALFSRLRAEVESTASSELREFLLGDLPPRSYQSSEGTGRRKRTVTRTYTPLTDFRDQEKKAREALDRSKYDEYAKALKAAITEGIRKLAADDKRRSEVAKLEDRRWSLGWPGTRATLPAPVEEQ